MDIARAQEALKYLGYDPGVIDGIWGPRTLAALNAWQKATRRSITTELTEEHFAILVTKTDDETKEDDLSSLTLSIVCKMCPNAPHENLETYLPFIKSALRKYKLTDKPMVLAAIATIRAESSSFKPISEFVSRFNTDSGAPFFNRYDNRKNLGNTGAPDGARYRGRGFVQLTGRANYRKYGQRLDIDLESNPDQANEGYTAAMLLAAFLSDCATKMRAALRKEDYAAARRYVNGGKHGLAVFEEAYKAGMKLLKG